MSLLRCIDFDYGFCSSRCFISSTQELPCYEEHGYCSKVHRHVVWCRDGFVEDMVRALRENKKGAIYG
jgi:hypothetical protein